MPNFRGEDIKEELIRSKKAVKKTAYPSQMP
jgi:hypothetical protein